MVTLRGACMLGGAALAWGVARLLGVRELYMIAAAALALVICGFVAVHLAGVTVAVRRRVSTSRLEAGGSCDATLELRNDGRLPTAVLLVEDQCPYTLLDGQPGPGSAPRYVVPGLAAGRTVQLRYRLVGQGRGRYEIGPVRIAMRDPFALVQRVRRSTTTEEIVVHPRVEPLTPSLSRGTHRGSGASDARRLFNAGDEFYTLREYATGDDLRHVHWPSTAHRQTLMVRQHEMPWESQAIVLCDTRREMHSGSGPEATLERAVSAAASLVCHFAERGYRLRLVTETDADPLGGGTESRGLMLDRLAVLEASRGKTLRQVLHRIRMAGTEGLLAAVVSPPPGPEPVTRDPDARALVQTGHSFSGKVAVIVSGVGEQSPQRQTAQAYALMLRSAGWRAAILWPGGSLAEAWRSLTADRPRGGGYHASHADATPQGVVP